MPNFSIPLSGLTAESTALSAIANNLANQNTSGYLTRFGADKVRIVACGDYLWVRLESGSANVSILFRRPVEGPANLSWNSSRASVPNSFSAKVVAGGADNS